jgi:C-terminal processing protease CtpA/Prc
MASLLIFPLVAQTPVLSKNDRDISRTMLRQIREDLDRYYYDPTFHGIDLKARFADAETRLDVAANASDATAILTDVVMQLNDSHTMFYPPRRSASVEYGWSMSMIGDQPLVVDVAADSDAAAKGLAPGDRVLALNRFQPARDNLWQIRYLYHFVRPQAQQHLVVRKPDGTERTLDVLSRVTNKSIEQLDDLIDEIEAAPLVLDRDAPVGADILVWRMPGFRGPDAVQRAIRKARGYKTLILDLRGNGGGALTALSALVSATFDHEVLVAVDRPRGKERPEIAKPAKNAFLGKLFVLVDSRSASASEMFARIVQLEKRGAVVGDRTAGAVMAAQFVAHTVGLGAVAFYAMEVTVADVRMSDGAGLEKIGVAPDVLALPSPADLAAKRDPVLARAVELAGGSMTPEQAGQLFAAR